MKRESSIVNDCVNEHPKKGKCLSAICFFALLCKASSPCSTILSPPAINILQHFMRVNQVADNHQKAIIYPAIAFLLRTFISTAQSYYPPY